MDSNRFSFFRQHFLAETCVISFLIPPNALKTHNENITAQRIFSAQ